ncbi:MAG: M20/M25/M40 family metallo-hydrolase [bacterium]|nr:M20/M25/M40 family metallo-hydrolase [bacterium]
MMNRLEARVFELATDADGDIGVEAIMNPDTVEPVAMDEGLQEHVAAAAESHAPNDWIRMPSGAGHDAQVLALRMPSAMLFVPSIGGISHDFAENTADEDLILGCQVLATATESILKAE